MIKKIYHVKWKDLNDYEIKVLLKWMKERTIEYDNPQEYLEINEELHSNIGFDLKDDIDNLLIDIVNLLDQSEEHYDLYSSDGIQGFYDDNVPDFYKDLIKNLKIQKEFVKLAMTIESRKKIVRDLDYMEEEENGI